MHWLQYVLGLRDLGHSVLYLEDTGAWYYDPVADEVVESCGTALAHLEATMRAHGLQESWTFIDHTGEEYGVTGRKLAEFLDSADLLVHVTGAMYLRDRYRRIPRRAYVDTDPGFVQFRAAGGSEKDAAHLRSHNCHFSFGCNIGTPACSIPTLGLHWQPTVQPLCLDLWPLTPGPSVFAPLTTVVKWQGYKPEKHNGNEYGLKDVEFMRFIELPARTEQPLELAMAGAPPVEGLEARGWTCRNGPELTKTFEDYRNYLQYSRGEWSVAKNGYVKANSGWFSDRSAAYLALGRPVVVQSTGFETWLPTGLGVLSFASLDEACAAIETLNSDYDKHCSAARDIAVEYFAAPKVLSHLLQGAQNAEAGPT